MARLRHYHAAHILPDGADLARILATSGLSEMALMLRLGRPSRAALAALTADPSAALAIPAASPDVAALPPPDDRWRVGQKGVSSVLNWA